MKKTKLMLEVEKRINEPIEEFLHREYSEKRKSALEIKKVVGVNSGVTVYNWLKKIGVKRRPLHEHTIIKMKTKLKPLGNLIRKERIDRGWSQKDLVNKSGLIAIQVRRFELGYYKEEKFTLRTKRNLRKMLEILEIPEDVYLKVAPFLEEIVPFLEEKLDYSKIHTLGSLIRYSKEQKGWTIPRLSKICSVSKNILRSIEKGIHGTTEENLEKIVKSLNIPVEQIRRFIPSYKKPIDYSNIKSLGELIRKYRKGKGMYTRELGKKTNIRTGSINSYERDGNKPPIKKLRKIVNTLKIPKEDVLKFYPDFNSKYKDYSLEEALETYIDYYKKRKGQKITPLKKFLIRSDPITLQIRKNSGPLSKFVGEWYKTDRKLNLHEFLFTKSKDKDIISKIRKIIKETKQKDYCKEPSKEESEKFLKKFAPKYERGEITRKEFYAQWKKRFPKSVISYIGFGVKVNKFGVYRQNRYKKEIQLLLENYIKFYNDNPTSHFPLKRYSEEFKPKTWVYVRWQNSKERKKEVNFEDYLFSFIKDKDLENKVREIISDRIEKIKNKYKERIRSLLEGYIRFHKDNKILYFSLNKYFKKFRPYLYTKWIYSKERKNGTNFEGYLLNIVNDKNLESKVKEITSGERLKRSINPSELKEIALKYVESQIF